MMFPPPSLLVAATGSVVAETVSMGVFIALGGSSSPELYISHRDAEGALYFDQKHPGHQVFPGVSACEDKH